MRDVYAQAEDDYQTGRTEQARDLLLQNLRAFQGNLRQNALRLIALSYLENFDVKQTEYYATMMLEQNPYYTVSAQDPPEFADIVNHIKAGMTATVTTASNISESLDEVPVPTTLITEEMIAACGGRNLQEVLAAYVPGISIVDCNNDINISMRSIHSSTQEMMLFMLNGHRLNSYLTNTAAPDFSISLEKIKRIEVLRGPASSLYGDVALTGVVNIITKQGADVDGVQIKAGAGNYGQIRGDLLIGRRLYDLDVMAWASVYASSGERRSVDTERRDCNSLGEIISEATVGRVGDLPTYDLGCQLSMKGWRLLYNTRFSQIVAPYSTLATTYDRDHFRNYNGIKPSYATAVQHADLSYSHQAGPLSLSYGATYDKEDITRYDVFSESQQPGTIIIWSCKDYPELTEYGGLSRYMNGQSQDLGLRMNSAYDYTLGSAHKGTIMLGAEYDHFNLYGMRVIFGYDYNRETPESPDLRDYSLGHENAANVAVQLKHQWHSLILNAGCRYDHKHRHDDTNANEWSPRVALILLRPRWNMRLCYSRAFVDFPYINPININPTPTFVPPIAGYWVPQRINSWQLSVAGNNRTNSLHLEGNLFYNHANDLTLPYLYNISFDKEDRTVGLELKGSYRRQRFTADLDMTWTHTIKTSPKLIEVNDIPAQDLGADKNNNMPAIVANCVLAWQPIPRLRLHTHIQFESSQVSYFADTNRYMQMCNILQQAFDALEEQGNMETFEELIQRTLDVLSTARRKEEMSARAVINLGGEYTLGPVTIGLNIHNLLNTSYYRSGINTNLIPQQGRWFLATLGVKI